MAPSRATAYSLPSCEPKSTVPSSATAGDETTGPPVATVQAISGLPAGRLNGERPRWAAPSRNIACAGSSAYCGSAATGPLPAAAAPAAEPPRAPCDQTQVPASHTRSSLQSRSEPQLPPRWAQSAKTTLASATANVAHRATVGGGGIGGRVDRVAVDRTARAGTRSRGARSRWGANHERNILLMTARLG